MVIILIRIAARVDQLEAGLRRSQADSEKLMEAVVGKMLAGGDIALRSNLNF